MKFRNKLDQPLSFDFHGRRHTVPARGEWECSDRVAFAVERSSLPLVPIDTQPTQPSDEPEATKAADETPMVRPPARGQRGGRPSPSQPSDEPETGK